MYNVRNFIETYDIIAGRRECFSEYIIDKRT